MSVQWYIASILTGVSQALKPLVDALDSPAAFADFLARFGYESVVTDIQQIEDKFAQVKKAYDALEKAAQYVDELRGGGSPSLTDIVSAVQNLASTATGMMKAIEGLKGMTGYAALPDPLNQESFWKDFPPELAGSLLHRYLDAHKPRLFGLLTVLGILSVEDVDAQSLPPFRRPYQRRQVNWERIGLIVSHPDQLMSKVYSLGNTFEHSRLTGNLAILADTFGLPAAQAELSEEVLTAYYGGNAQKTVRQLLVPLYWDSIETGGGYGYTSLDLIVAPIPPTGNPGNAPSGFVFFPVLRGHAGKGIEIAPSVIATLEGGFEGAGPVRLEVRPEEVRVVVPPALGAEIGAAAKLTVATEKALILVGAEESSRFEIGRIGIELSARGPVTDLEYRLGLAAEAATLLVYLTEGDGFLQKSMPREGLNVQLDFQLGWSSKRGFYFGTNAELAATIPVHVSLLNVLNVDSVYLAIRTNTRTSDIETILAATASIKLGPFTANVERMGLLAKVTFPPNGGNLGPANLALDFKPPDGAGIAIDASAVVGGGYLFFDPQNEQYAGILQLEIKGGISLKAIGLLTTRLPGLPPETKGFSLLVIIAAEFSPIQLGFGFSLTGVGGLLGVNRTMVLDALRLGITNHTLDSILFPQNPIERAPQIISDLQSIFPPVTGQFVFGPMAKLAWGKPATILTIDLGIVLEFPSPLRLAIMGRLKMVLPSQEAKEELQKVVLRMDVLGAIDFDKGDASIDAILYDSRVVEFAISGGMAMRLNWGASPAFALAVGGFNPRFQPPPSFPALDRLSISLATDENLQLRLEGYLALTSNTVQFGARLDLYAAVEVTILKTFRISVEAYLGFDGLVQFSPLSFIIDIYGGAAIKVDGNPLLAIQIQVAFSGFTPLQACGEATVVILGVKGRIPVDLTLGSGEPPPLPPPIDVLAELRNSLADLRNWSAQLPSDGHMLVTLRKIEVSNEVLVHPFGELTVRQKVVPLDVAISKFGNTTPDNPGPFTITSIRLGTQATEQSSETVKDHFARGQFFEMSDEEKLALPAFEPMPSGCTRIGTAAINYSSVQVPTSFQYDTVVIDNKEELISRKGKEFEYEMAQGVLLAMAELGAAGQSAMRSTGAAKFAGPTKQQVKFKDTEYVVASTDDMAWEATSKTSKKPTYTEAEAARREKGASSNKYQVVGSHEVA